MSGARRARLRRFSWREAMGGRVFGEPARENCWRCRWGESVCFHSYKKPASPSASIRDKLGSVAARQSAINLDWVRTASPVNGSDRCVHTNRGNCATWPLFFCDMKRSQKLLSRNLQRALNETGECLVDGTAL
ncbi:unnamed protein product [Prorocentrum cordatum]|uniref:Uncharacterized protein n=1 Tax=Prorocentrum cordatum TaxID=2364126 RepID=A0ABN9RZ27_9DINO|nr:unnamed protein product [Polarella glacialis]